MWIFIQNKCLPNGFFNFSDNDSNTNTHGPYAGGDKFLYLLGRLGPSEEYSHDIGRVASPMYTQSSAECRLDIYFFVNGTTGQCEGTNDPAALGIAIWIMISHFTF